MAKDPMIKYAIIAGGTWLGYSMALRGGLGSDMQNLALDIQKSIKSIGGVAIGGGDGGGTPSPIPGGGGGGGSPITGIGSCSNVSIVDHSGNLVPPMCGGGWRSYPQFDPQTGRTGIYETDDRGNFNGPIAWA